MSLNRKDVLEIIHNPSLLQQKQLDMLSNSLNGDFTISDPTNPFTMLLEATNATAAASVIECNNIIRKKYPSLANVEDDLYHHLHDNQMSFVFATPAEVVLDFYVNIIDLKNEGYRPEGASYVETTIPRYTSVEVLNIPLLLLNDIVVKLYDNNSIFVEQQLNKENELSYSDIGTLNSDIINSQDGTPWIMLRTKVKQLSQVVVSKAVVASEVFQQVANIKDLYCYCTVAFKNKKTGNTYKNMNISYNDTYIDPLSATAHITPYSKKILVRIPSQYILDGSVTGTVNTTVYETKGKMYLPINKYDVKDFIIKLGNVGTNKSTATIKNISLLANSKGIINGGTNSITGLELRDIIINGVKETTLPVTTKQIQNSGKLMGYKVVLDKDVVTSRAFIALRSLPDAKSNMIQSKPDIIFGTLRLILGEVLNNENIILNKYNIDYERGTFVIKANSIFKDDNGIVTLLTNQEREELKQLKTADLMQRLSREKYFFNPYYYVIEVNEKYTDYRVYDLDNPSIDNLRIQNKNLAVEQRVNIDRYDIQKIETGYKILMTLAPNNEFSQIDKSTIKMQLRIPLAGNNNFVFIDSIYNKEENWYEFFIATDFMVDNEDMITVLNGNSEIYTKKVKLNTKVSVYTLSRQDSITTDKSFMENEINTDDRGIYLVFTREDIDLSLGKSLDNIYKKLYSYYTSKKYLTYEEDVIATYKEDVYKIDTEIGSPFHCRLDLPNPQDNPLSFEILHRKGDVIKDPETQEPVVLHKQGDPILKNNEPQIDMVNGVVRNIDLLLLEYEYLVANTNAYINYRKLVVETINNYILTDMKNLNNKLLENTIVMYKSYKTNRRVEILINGVSSSLPYIIQPKLTLYLRNAGEIKEYQRENYRTIIGNIINKHLDNSTIVINDIRKDIIEAIGSTLVGVSIDGIGKEGSEVIDIKNENVKLTLDKQLVTDAAGYLVVKYNIVLNIQHIQG